MIKNIQLLAILLLPVYFILPTGENSHFTICPFFHLTGVPCPGCGMGRALVHIFHLHFIEALYYNPFGFLVAAAQCYVIMSFFFPSLVTVYQQYNRFFVLGQYIFGVLFIGFGLVRIWAFVTANAYLLQYFYDFHKTFSLMRWLQT
jgi:hypothetical protein